MSEPQQSEGIKDSLSSSITDSHIDHRANIACSSSSLPVSAISGKNQSSKTESIMKLKKIVEAWVFSPSGFQPNAVGS